MIVARLRSPNFFFVSEICLRASCTSKLERRAKLGLMLEDEIKYVK